jgi:ABC-2 type transport system permease protein
MTRGQLRAILWLRWRLTRNQWTRSQGLGAVVALAMGAASVLGSIASLGGGLAAGWYLGRGGSPAVLQLVEASLAIAFVFTWSIGVLVELQRSELIDVPRLLQFPVRLAPVFLVNYAASHVGMSVVLFVPAMVGVAVGAAAARGPAQLAIALPALALVFSATAWTYCFQGWIAAWMTNPRRRRFVVMGLALTVVLMGQLPNVLFNVLHVLEIPGSKQAIQMAISPAGALLATVVLVGLGAIALWRGYRATVRFYRGESGGTSRRVNASEMVEKGANAKPSTRLVERRLPGLSEQASAVATASLRSVLRAPEAAMAFGAAMIVTCILGATMILRLHARVPRAFAPLVLEGVMAFSIFMLVPFLCNQFGFDRDGFRSLLLSPVERRDLLVGKNAACLVLGLGACIPLLVVATITLRPEPLVVASALLQVATMLLTAATVGNVLSVLVPYRMAAGSLKATGLPPSAFLAVLGCQLFFPVLFLPAFVPSVAFLLWHRARWSMPGAVEVLLALIIALATAGIYLSTLSPVARMLQRRETIVLARVTVDSE